MSTYAAPIADMRFVLDELAGLREVCSLPGYDDIADDVLEAVLEEAGRFAREILDPLNASGDRAGARLDHGMVAAAAGFADAYRRFVDGGWNGISAPQRFGGQGLPRVLSVAVEEMWDSANLSFALAPMLTAGVVEALTRHGSAEQIETLLPALIAGRWCGTMNLTEPQAGSDLSAVRTMATAAGDSYRIRGTKIFITWGEHDLAENIVHLVLARTPDAPPGVKGLSLFVVPKFAVAPDGGLGARNDVRCVSIERKLGIHASPTCVLNYGEGAGATGYLVGELHRGLEYMFTMMNHARLAVGIEGVAIAERACQQAMDYAHTRIQGTDVASPGGERVAIARHPDVRRMLGSMKCRTEALRALAYFAAGAYDRAACHTDPGERARQQSLVDLLTPVVKGWCTEEAVDITSLGIQVHGGAGYVEETGAAQYWRDARVTTIYEGTTGIQANDLVRRKIIPDRGAAALLFVCRMREDVAAIRAHPELAGVAAKLDHAVDALESATRWLTGAEPARAAAVAVPYLQLFGTVCGGWLMGRAALAALRRLSSPRDAGDTGFLAGKISSARYYADHILPRSHAYAAATTDGASSVLEMHFPME